MRRGSVTRCCRRARTACSGSSRSVGRSPPPLPSGSETASSLSSIVPVAVVSLISPRGALPSVRVSVSSFSSIPSSRIGTATVFAGVAGVECQRPARPGVVGADRRASVRRHVVDGAVLVARGVEPDDEIHRPRAFRGVHVVRRELAERAPRFRARSRDGPCPRYFGELRLRRRPDPAGLAGLVRDQGERDVIVAGGREEEHVRVSRPSSGWVCTDPTVPVLTLAEGAFLPKAATASGRSLKVAVKGPTMARGRARVGTRSRRHGG